MGPEQGVIINADDFGLADGVSEAIDILLKMNAISNTTVMTLARGVWKRTEMFPYAFKYRRAGVHLQLSGGVPLTKISNKFMSFQNQITGEFVGKEEIVKAKPAEIKKEWGAQILEFMLKLGDTPTHIDSHMGFHRRDVFSDAYLELAVKYNLPVRGGEEPFLTRMYQSKVQGTTAFVRGWSGKGLPLRVLKEKLNSLKKNCDPLKDTIELTCHPGFVDSTLLDCSSLTYGREQDFKSILELHETNWLARNGFKLQQFSDFPKTNSSDGGPDAE